MISVQQFEKNSGKFKLIGHISGNSDTSKTEIEKSVSECYGRGSYKVYCSQDGKRSVPPIMYAFVIENGNKISQENKNTEEDDMSEKYNLDSLRDYIAGKIDNLAVRFERLEIYHQTEIQRLRDSVSDLELEIKRLSETDQTVHEDVNPIIEALSKQDANLNELADNPAIKSVIEGIIKNMVQK